MHEAGSPGTHQQGGGHALLHRQHRALRGDHADGRGAQLRGERGRVFVCEHARLRAAPPALLHTHAHLDGLQRVLHLEDAALGAEGVHPPVRVHGRVRVNVHVHVLACAHSEQPSGGAACMASGTQVHACMEGGARCVSQCATAHPPRASMQGRPPHLSYSLRVRNMAAVWWFAS